MKIPVDYQLLRFETIFTKMQTEWMAKTERRRCAV